MDSIFVMCVLFCYVLSMLNEWDESVDVDFLINCENVLVNLKGVCVKVVL